MGNVGTQRDPPKCNICYRSIMGCLYHSRHCLSHHYFTINARFVAITDLSGAEGNVDYIDFTLEKIKYGMPQGSIRGPLLLAIYISMTS